MQDKEPIDNVTELRKPLEAGIGHTISIFVENRSAHPVLVNFGLSGLVAL